MDKQIVKPNINLVDVNNYNNNVSVLVLLK